MATPHRHVLLGSILALALAAILYLLTRSGPPGPATAGPGAPGAEPSGGPAPAGIFEIVPLAPRSYAVVCDQDGFGGEQRHPPAAPQSRGAESRR